MTTEHLATLEAFADAVFGRQAGDEPDIYADFDALTDWERRVRQAIAAISREHDRRVTELLEANNREVERRRAAEAQVAAMRATVVEECAKVADDAFLHGTLGEWDKGWNHGTHTVAQRIRALVTRS